MIFLFGVTFCAVEPFAAWWDHQTFKLLQTARGGGDKQHGDRMATCALRMCLLSSLSSFRIGAMDVVALTTFCMLAREV